MTALFYLLGFLSGLAAAAVVLLILRSRRRRLERGDELSRAYRDILDY